MLVLAGAGSGKTATLARAAWLICGGADSSRMCLLTFSRRAAGDDSDHIAGDGAGASGPALAQIDRLLADLWA